MEKEIINIYCDESCHLENDHERAMVFGCVRYPQSLVSEISKEIRSLKRLHHIYPFAEIKWKTVSRSKEEFYVDLLDLFLNTERLKFRAVVFQNKDLHKLEHKRFQDQTYEDWYYKMFHLTLEKIIDRKNAYNIYLDKKNPNCTKKLNKLKSFLSRKATILNMQNVVSHESSLIQMTDFLTGIVSYANRDAIKKENANQTKVKLVEILRERSNLSLISQTPRTADKINIFMWEPDYYET